MTSQYVTIWLDKEDIYRMAFSSKEDKETN